MTGTTVRFSLREHEAVRAAGCLLIFRWVLGPSTFHQVPTPCAHIKAVRREPSGADTPLRLCVTNTSSRQGAKAQRKRGYRYNDGAGGAIGYCLPALRAELPACQSRWRKKGADLFLRGPILRVPGHRKRETVRAGRSRKRAGLISSPQPIIKTSGHHMSPLQGFVCFRA